MDYHTLPEILKFMRSRYDNPPALKLARENGWTGWSAEEFYRAVVRLALGLQEHGIKGQNIGLIAPSSPYWLMVDLAIMLSGNVTVPIFKRISAESMSFEVRDSKIRCMFIGLESELEMVRAHGKGVKTIVPLQISADGSDILPFEKLMDSGRAAEEGDSKREPELFDRLAADDLATIIYTSGSTGHPKGVELSQHNIVSQVKAAVERFPRDGEREAALSSLPPAHIFERMILYYNLASGISIYFVDRLERIGELIRDVRPTVITVVPRLLEKIYERFRDTLQARRGLSGLLARKALQRAESKPADELASGAADFIYRRLVYRKLHAALGGRLQLIISGASPLRRQMGRFFLNAGFPLFEGYGLTEASPVIAVNYPGHNKLGTVGPVYPGVEVRIADDGEILARGPNIMRGYHNNPQATKETLDAEGFLHTGDLGSLDGEGYLTVTGRKKELFKKSTGEYVAPVPIEQRLAAAPYIDRAIVVADQRKFPSALIFPNMEKAAELQQQTGREAQSVEEFVNGPEFRKELDAVIKEVNNELHHTEEIRDFAVIPENLTVEDGELTPTLKLRRHVVEEKYRETIEAIYSQASTQERLYER